jgi:hypothetical protein
MVLEPQRFQDSTISMKRMLDGVFQPLAESLFLCYRWRRPENEDTATAKQRRNHTAEEEVAVLRRRPSTRNELLTLAALTGRTLRLLLMQ